MVVSKEDSGFWSRLTPAVRLTVLVHAGAVSFSALQDGRRRVS
ncbi:hypothetical protein Nmel_007363 [Mimus melanotis]